MVKTFDHDTMLRDPWVYYAKLTNRRDVYMCYLSDMYVEFTPYYPQSDKMPKYNEESARKFKLKAIFDFYDGLLDMHDSEKIAHAIFDPVIDGIDNDENEGGIDND